MGVVQHTAEREKRREWYVKAPNKTIHSLPPSPRLGVAPYPTPERQPAAPSPASRWAAADNRYLCAAAE